MHTWEDAAVSEYLVDTERERALARLRTKERLQDPGTIRHLEVLGVAPGWRCLEVGAGTGSIAAWLSRRVEPSGRVLATDLDTDFLEELDLPGLEMALHDAVEDDLETGAFDLVHARDVLRTGPAHRKRGRPGGSGRPGRPPSQPALLGPAEGTWRYRSSLAKLGRSATGEGPVRKPPGVTAGNRLLMRFHTHECRWFFEGPPPERVETWFRKASPWKREAGIVPPEWPAEWREDRYVVFPGRDDLGLKSRVEAALGGGVWARIELKGRTAELGPVELGPGADGLAERWVKWSYDTGEVPESIRAIFQGAQASAVRKKRLLRRVRLDPGALAVELPPGVLPDGRALSAELTRVQLEDEAFWTLGLEAHPCDEGTHVDFVVAATSLLESYPGEPSLTLDRSWSYPRWLIEVTPVPGG